MDIQELRGKTGDELQSLLLDSKKEAFNLRFQKVAGANENTARIREVRRTIARVKTLLNQPEALRAVAVKAEKPKKAEKAPKVKKADKAETAAEAEAKESKKTAARKSAAKKKTA